MSKDVETKIGEIDQKAAKVTGNRSVDQCTPAEQAEVARIHQEGGREKLMEEWRGYQGQRAPDRPAGQFDD